MSRPGTDDGSGHGELPASVIVSVTFLLVIVILAVTTLTWLGKPVQNLIVIVGTIIVPTVTALLAIRNSRQVHEVRASVDDVRYTVAEVGDSVHEVRGKVDEKIDNLIVDKSNLETQIANAGIVPITAKISWDPDSTGPIARQAATDTAEQPAQPPAPPPAQPPAPPPAPPAHGITVSDILSREGYGNGG